MCGAQCKRMSNYETAMSQDVSVTQPVLHPGPAAHSQGPLKMDRVRELPGQYRPKLGLSPPEPRMETDLDTYPWQLWWADSPSLGLTFLAGFSGIPKQGGRAGSTLGDF